MKTLRKEVPVGFVWEDPERGHLVARGDVSDGEFLLYLLERVEASSYDLVLADPPYQVSSSNVLTLEGRKDMFLSESYDGLSDGQMEDLLREFPAALREVTRNSNVWVWISDWWLSTVKRVLKDEGLRVWPTYVWCKSNPPFSIRKRCVVSACEFLVMASRGGDFFFDLEALPRQRNWFVAAPEGEFAPAVSPFWVERPVVHAAERLRREGEKEYVNRAQKPLDVTEALIRAGSPEGGLVLDAFGGTGTGLVAADRAGRRVVYVEADGEQVRRAARRLLEDRKERV